MENLDEFEGYPHDLGNFKMHSNDKQCYAGLFHFQVHSGWKNRHGSPAASNHSSSDNEPLPS